MPHLFPEICERVAHTTGSFDLRGIAGLNRLADRHPEMKFHFVVIFDVPDAWVGFPLDKARPGMTERLERDLADYAMRCVPPRESAVEVIACRGAEMKEHVLPLTGDWKSARKPLMRSVDSRSFDLLDVVVGLAVLLGAVFSILNWLKT